MVCRHCFSRACTMDGVDFADPAGIAQQSVLIISATFFCVNDGSGWQLVESAQT